ncbi:MAG: Lrp/AsnC family transcriptional regulator [Promethearchaeota archaeon]
MDEKDKLILQALEKDSRMSLKKLAKDLDIRTNAIYQRIQKLQNAGILKGYSIIIDPDKLGLIYHYLIKVRLQKMITNKPDQIFLQSTSKYLAETYKNIMLAGVGEDDTIYLIVTFNKPEELQAFLDDVQVKPLMEEVETVRLLNFAQGTKLFRFIDAPMSKDDERIFFDDTLGEDDDVDEDEDNIVEF